MSKPDPMAYVLSSIMVCDSILNMTLSISDGARRSMNGNFTPLEIIISKLEVMLWQ